jgi:ATP-binding cassette subfamily A (ABC1) protein 1
MDPGARRFLWNCILEMIRGGQSVVLTSHSMEECEALCTRMGIMVNGKFQCLGSAQHLKNRFGSGYTLTLRSDGRPEAIGKLKELASKTFPLAELKEEHYNQLQFQLPPKHTKLPLVFREMEKAKASTGTADHEKSFLEDYSITQTTLDEVSCNFLWQHFIFFKQSLLSDVSSTHLSSSKTETHFDCLSVWTAAA